MNIFTEIGAVAEERELVSKLKEKVISWCDRNRNTDISEDMIDIKTYYMNSTESPMVVVVAAISK